MDDFGMERPELRGTLISLEFGTGGRIYQLWAADPALPETSDEFQFVLGPVSFGEEFSEDYYPGTVLIGARTQPDEPWVVSRNANVVMTDTDDDANVVQFEYDFPLLPEIRATGKFYEVINTLPQIVWELQIVNRGRTSIEIGEIGFPFAFFNFMQGASRDEQGGRNPYHDRVYIHKFIGGAASYLHAQRRSNEAPGLLVFPGDDTHWEICAHVPRSLKSSYHWEGIPVVYLYSRATVEREGWAAHGEHTSFILEPGDSHKFETRFVPTSPALGDAVFHTLSACGRPAIRTLPAAVAPTSVGIALEVGGISPSRFFVSRESSVETDTDESGGFCFIRPQDPGLIRVSFEDGKRNLGYAQLLFTEPIDVLIKKRSKWITDFQFHEQEGSNLNHAFLLTHIRTHERISAMEDYVFPFSLESGLCDALFLAEKNVHYPVVSEVEKLEAFVRDFLMDDLHNPATGDVGCSFADGNSVALNFARPRIYPLVFNFYHTLYRIQKFYGLLSAPAIAYLQLAVQVAFAFFRVADRLESGGMPGYSMIIELVNDMEAEGLEEPAAELRRMMMARARIVIRQPISDTDDLTGDAARFEEMFWSARILGEQNVEQLALNHAFASRDLGPAWHSYGSDYRVFHENEGVPQEFIKDKGQLMLGHTTIANSLMFFESFNEDYMFLDDAKMRMAFGGMLGPWALIRPDGAASMGFCPDPASEQYGASPITGDIGLSLFYYLRRVRSVVLPSPTLGTFTFGCHFEVDGESYSVQPWDGIGKRISIRQVGFDAILDVGRILEVKLDTRKRWVKVKIENATEFDVNAHLIVYGMWGRIGHFQDQKVEIVDGAYRVNFSLARGTISDLELRVE